MEFFDCTYPKAQTNLDIDEYLLKCVDKGRARQGICRIWESPTPFVVLGLSKKIADDVNDVACRDDNIPILRRCTGGGTVLQGPGCFNYAFIYPKTHHPALAAIDTTTRYILGQVKDVLSSVIPGITHQGISDLTLNNLKFSGNAQRRLKHAVLFHGTILYNFDLTLIPRYLTNPPVQPAYRNRRPHHAFIQNIPITSPKLRDLFLSLTKGDITH
jgi:lipoate-protein ligase A